MNYRNDARKSLERAKAELGSGDDARLKYAALELRFCMEALTYDRALAYKAELPPKEYETWQPRKLMAVLLEIDPTADKDSSIAVGIEDIPGVPATVMEHLGSEKVFNLGLLKKHYDAVGNFLHVPTLKQSSAAHGGVDHKKLRDRCQEVAKYLEEVLASKVWNATIGMFAHMPCENCGAIIRKRTPKGTEPFSAACFECDATYTITQSANNQVLWKLDLVDVRCGCADCTHVTHILPKDFKPETNWKCDGCGGRNVLAMAVVQLPEQESMQDIDPGFASGSD